MNLSKEEQEWLAKAAESCAEKIKASDIFFSLHTDSSKTDALCALQLGLAVLYDKPIGVIAIRGSKVPETLRKIAFAVEHPDETDEDGLKESCKRILSAGVNRVK